MKIKPRIPRYPDIGFKFRVNTRKDDKIKSFVCTIIDKEGDNIIVKHPEYFNEIDYTSNVSIRTGERHLKSGYWSKV